MAKIRRTFTGASIATTTSSAIASSGTTNFTISAYTGWPSGSNPFFVVVEPGTPNEEKMLVTRANATDSSLTVFSTPSIAANRGLDGTSSVAHSSGAAIYPVFTAQDADEANEIASVLTSKGDLLGHGSSTFARVAVGTNNHVLVADSAQSAGVKWAQIDSTLIADSAVTAAKIADGAVGSDELAPGAVTTAKIGDGQVTAGKLAAGVIKPSEAVFTIPGPLTIGPRNPRFYVEDSRTIKHVVASVGTAPVGGVVVVDVNKNGTTIFTTQGGRPTIVSGGNYSPPAGPNVQSLSAGDYLTVDVDSVGSSTTGSNAVIRVVFE